MDDQIRAIAQTIANQLGGTRLLKAMVNGRNFTALDGDGGLKFNFSGSRKANTCLIKLDAGKDLYNVELWKITAGGKTVKQVFSLEGVYADMLVPTFETETGLYLSL